MAVSLSPGVRVCVCVCVCSFVCVCVSCGRPHTCQAARHRQGFVRLRECE